MDRNAFEGPCALGKKIREKKRTGFISQQEVVDEKKRRENKSVGFAVLQPLVLAQPSSEVAPFRPSFGILI